MKKRELLVFLAALVAAIAILVPLHAWATKRTTTEYQQISGRAIAKAFGVLQDSVKCNMPTAGTEATVNLSAGVQYRVACLADSWVRMGATATQDAPCTPLFRAGPEQYISSGDPQDTGAAAPVFHCVSATASTSCILTPVSDVQ